MRRTYLLLVTALLALLLAGCGASSNNSNGTTDVPQSTKSATPSLGIEPTVTASNEASPSPNDQASTPEGDSAALKEAAVEVVGLLRERDLNSLLAWIDPNQGLRFSPSTHLNSDADLVYMPDKLPTFKDTSKLKWGIADGSGDAIELTFREYYEKFVYNKDFADAPDISVNKIVGKGNVEFNVAKIYPNASYVEFHFPGFDEKLDGMDWQSLVLVFVPEDTDWKLVAILHGQWTV
ncbi:hypothetical protein D7Z26_23820 [Cohnella endophytica]|uniref:Uncharacterized protein n=1 Tax=Cohnella endophytica TaxID=2419778 RepID=A0A494X9X9_9BACL|nr:hypothetical protein [Cohnella endophytica]RKP47328.1 hypothetical protein D7Z26_23820 [Cohnella endophytica]